MNTMKKCFIQSGLKSKNSFYVEMPNKFTKKALSHFVKCPNVKQEVKDTLLQSKNPKISLKNDLEKNKIFLLLPQSCNSQSSSTSEFSPKSYIAKMSSTDDQTSESQNMIQVWQAREKLIDRIKEVHYKTQEKYIANLQSDITNETFDIPDHQTEFDSFINNDLILHQNRGLYMTIYQLLCAWNVMEYEEESSENEDKIEKIAKDQIGRKISELQEEIDAVSIVRGNVNRESAIDDYMSRTSAITTLQRSINGRQNRDVYIREMFQKQRFMIHIGGIDLDLTQENIVSAGKTINVLDLKDKDNMKKELLGVELKHSTMFMGVTTFGNNVFMSGGRNVFGQFILGDESPEVRKSLYSFNIKDKSLQNHAPMLYHRSHHGFIKFLGKLWAVGGTDGNGPLKSVESYDPMKNVWKKERDLNTARSGAMTVVHNYKIWIIGGRDLGGNFLQSLEIYDNISKKWSIENNLPEAIMLGSAVSVCSKLFVIGGMSGELSKPIALDTIYVLDETVGKWNIWIKMSEPRMNHGTTSYGTYITIIGGHNLVNNVLKQVVPAVCFDVRQNPPKELITPTLGSNKVGLGVVMFGDVDKIEESYAKINNRKLQRDSDFDSSFSSDKFSVKSASSEMQAFISRNSKSQNRK